MEFLLNTIFIFFYFHILTIIVLAIGIEMSFMGNSTRANDPDLNGVEKLIWVYLFSFVAFFFFDALVVFMGTTLVSLFFAHKAFFISLTFYKDFYKFLVSYNKNRE